jgi:hypothetical protein
MKKIHIFSVLSCVYLPFFTAVCLANTASTGTREQVIQDTLSRMESIVADINQDNPSITKDETSNSENKVAGPFHVSAGYDGNHLHYKELVGGDTLDEDYGKLYGFYLAAGYKSDTYNQWLVGRPFIEAYYKKYSALITYDGGSGLGPLSFDERAEIQRYGLKFGSAKNFLDKGELYGYFDVGQRIWYRGENEVIEGVLTYAEKYWWTYFGFGAGVTYDITQKLQAGLDVEFMFSTSSMAKMRADLLEGGTFELGGVNGADVKIPVKYFFSPKFSLDITPYFTYWHIKSSNTVKISDWYFYEPTSNTHIEGIQAGFSYYF